MATRIIGTPQAPHFDGVYVWNGWRSQGRGHAAGCVSGGAGPVYAFLGPTATTCWHEATGARLSRMKGKIEEGIAARIDGKRDIWIIQKQEGRLERKA